MAHTHAGNAGDFFKHTILAEVSAKLPGLFSAVRYIDPYCGESLFRHPTVYQPPDGHPKLAAFRTAQPALDEWYFGSPVVAARALAGCTASLVVADRDPDAIRSTKVALTSMDFWLREIPGVTPPHAAEVRTEVTEFDPRRLALALPPAANIVLLDPTHPAGYSDALRETIRVCRNASTAILLLAWGISSWHLPEVFERELLTHSTASFSNGGIIYEMVMSSFGETGLSEIAAEAALGW